MKAGETYTLSLHGNNIESQGCTVFFYDEVNYFGETSGGIWFQQNNYCNYTCSVDRDITLILLRVSTGSSFPSSFQIQLERGSEKHDYLPYNENSSSGTYKNGELITVETTPSSGYKVEGYGRTQELVNLMDTESFANELITKADAMYDSHTSVIYTTAKNIEHKEFCTNIDYKSNTSYTIILYGINTNTSLRHCTNLQIKYTDGSLTHMYFGSNVFSGQMDYAIFNTDPTKTVECLSGYWFTYATYLNCNKCGIFEGAVTQDQFEQYLSNRFKNQLPLSRTQLEEAIEGGSWNDNTVTYLGIDITVNEDESGNIENLVLNGTNNTGTTQWIRLYRSEIPYFYPYTPGEQYIMISGNPNVNLQFEINNGETFQLIGANETFTAPNFNTSYEIYIRISSGTSYNNEVVKPMIYSVRESDSSYVPYGVENIFNQNNKITFTLTNDTNLTAYIKEED